MRPLTEQAESILRDVADHGVRSIEKIATIDKLVHKLEAVESEEVIIAKINGIIQKHGRDIEAVNSDTSKVVNSLLKELGYKKLVALLEEMPSW